MSHIDKKNRVQEEVEEDEVDEYDDVPDDGVAPTQEELEEDEIPQTTNKEGKVVSQPFFSKYSDSRCFTFTSFIAPKDKKIDEWYRTRPLELTRPPAREDKTIPHPLRYIFWCEEYTKAGIKHYQGWFAVWEKISHKTACSMFPGDHVESVMGSDLHNKKYCSKEGRPEFERGDRPKFRAKREKGVVTKPKIDYALLLKEAQETGVTSNVGFNYRHYRMHKEMHSDWIRNQKIVPEEPIVNFRPWQDELLKIVNGPTDPRAIYWVVDKKGGAGKSVFAEHLEYHHNALVITTNDDYRNLSNLLPKDPTLIVFDYPYAVKNFPCSFMESCKNGRVTSTKYEGKIHKFKRPHIIVLTNHEAPSHQFAEGRLKIILL